MADFRRIDFARKGKNITEQQLNNIIENRAFT